MNDFEKKIINIKRVLLYGIGPSYRYKKARDSGNDDLAEQILIDIRKKLYKQGKMEKELEILFQLDTDGQKLNINNPKTICEKMQWLKIYDSTPVKTRLEDKYLAKEWINERLGGEYAVPLIGVWDKYEDIPFDKLPNKFVLKTNNGTKSNIFFKDKAPEIQETTGEIIKITYTEAKRLINKWLNFNYGFYCMYILYYENIQPKIIAEQWLEDFKEYKFFCVNGRIEYIYDFTPNYINGKKQKAQGIYSENWERYPWTTDRDYPVTDHLVPKPNNFEEMVRIAKELSQDFSLVRVDFYSTKERVYVGELTFIPGGGASIFSDPKVDREMGDRFILPIPTTLNIKIH